MGSRIPTKKSLGQHILVNIHIARQVVDALEGQSYSRILEIGPGPGTLTTFLTSRYGSGYYAVEIDARYHALLQETYPSLAGHFILADVMQADLQELLVPGTAIIGNFPYNISSPLVFRLLEHFDSIPVIVGMFQKEVAQRLHAGPGSKQYGILSVLLQSVYEVEYLFEIHASQFHPPPKVTSAVIRCRKRQHYDQNLDRSKLKTLVKMAFNQRRKMLRNSLKGLHGFEHIPEKYLTLRPEQISIDNFEEMARLIS